MPTPVLSVGFLVLGAGTVALGVALGGGAALGLGWAGLSFVVVGMAYLGQSAVIFSKDPVSGRLAWWSKLALLPYLLMTWGLWHMVRVLSREPPHAVLVPGVHIGRRLLSGEYPAGIRAVVDLTAELDEPRPADRDHQYFNVPVLDGASLPAAELRRLAVKIAALPRPVYIHCAQGHGRTAMVAAALLVVLGDAVSPSQALEQVAACRPGARPNRAQRRSVLALEEA